MEEKVRTLLRLLTLAFVATIVLAGAAGYELRANLVAQPATMAAAAQPSAFSEPAPVTTGQAPQAQPSAGPVSPTTVVDDEAAELAGQPDVNEAAEPVDAADTQPETDNQPDTTDPSNGD
jgi:hypothetical protein